MNGDNVMLAMLVFIVVGFIMAIIEWVFIANGYPVELAAICYCIEVPVLTIIIAK